MKQLNYVLYALMYIGALIMLVPAKAAIDCGSKPKVTLKNSLAEIDKAYREFILTCHPDKRPHVESKRAQAEYISGVEAYDSLKSMKKEEETGFKGTKPEAKPEHKPKPKDKDKEEEKKKTWEKFKNILNEKALFDAISEGDLEKVTSLLESGVSPDTIYASQPMLAVAIRKKQLLIIKLLLKHGADVNIEDLGVPMLIRAIDSNSPIIVKLLLEKGADANAQYIIKPALTLAIDKGNLDIVRLLLEHGANPNEKYLYTTAPLHTAAKNNNIDLASLLLKHGAEVDITDNLGKTPLMYAATNNNEQMIKLLIAHGADVCLKDFMNQRAYNLSSLPKLKKLLVCLR